MDELKMFSSEMEQGEKTPEDLTPEEIEQIIITVPPEAMKPLPEEIRKKVEALRKKWEEEHKDSQ